FYRARQTYRKGARPCDVSSGSKADLPSLRDLGRLNLPEADVGMFGAEVGFGRKVDASRPDTPENPPQANLICPTGSFSEFVSTPQLKIFSLFRKRKSLYMHPIPPRSKRDGRVVTDVEAGCGGR